MRIQVSTLTEATKLSMKQTNTKYHIECVCLRRTNFRDQYLRIPYYIACMNIWLFSTLVRAVFFFVPLSLHVLRYMLMHVSLYVCVCVSVCMCLCDSAVLWINVVNVNNCWSGWWCACGTFMRVVRNIPSSVLLMLLACIENVSQSARYVCVLCAFYTA